MLANFSNSTQRNLEKLTNRSNVIYRIELKTTIHYISIFISLTFYSWLIIKHEYYFFIFVFTPN
jgi:hypothetical protein